MLTFIPSLVPALGQAGGDQQKTLRLPGWGCATSREAPVQVQPHEHGQGSLGSPGLDKLQEQLYKVTSSVR